MLPKNGIWEDGDKPGNCLFILSDEAEIKYQKGGKQVSVTGAEVKEMFGIQGVMYRNNEPDFTPFVDPVLGVVDVSGLPTKRDGTGGTYDVAIKSVIERSNGLFKTKKSVLEYMNRNMLTWHETADRKHIMAIPTVINTAFKHTGGISKQESIEAVSSVIKDKVGTKMRLVKTTDEYSVESGNVNEIVDQGKQQFSQRKRENKRKR